MTNINTLQQFRRFAGMVAFIVAWPVLSFAQNLPAPAGTSACVGAPGLAQQAPAGCTTTIDSAYGAAGGQISPSMLPPGVTPQAAKEFLDRNPGLRQQFGSGSMGTLGTKGSLGAGAVPGAGPGQAQPPGPTGSDRTATAPVIEPEALAPRPGTFRFFLQQATGRNIPVFGQSLFAQGNTFTALQSQPVPANYVVGPGDELLLKIYGGAVEFDQQVVVDRSGMITLPKVGPLSVAGLSVAQLEPAIRKHLGRMLTDFNLYVSMGALRGIEIYVVGQARTPGKYVVSSVSTMINALFATGGPSERGSMRAIELVRDSKVIAKLDLYDFIARGDKSKDIRLLPGDVINIPATGPKVALIGAVANEAVYEIPPAPGVTFVKDLLALAGGLPVVTSPLEASLERVEPGRTRPLLAAKLALDDAGLNTPVKDGDILTLFPIKPAFENAVSLRVAGSAPVRIPIEAGARISDVIPSREVLLTTDFWLRRFAPAIGNDSARDRMAAIQNLSRIDQINWEQATVERLREDDLTTQVISFNLGRAILQKEPASNILLQSGDVITIYSQRSVEMPTAKQIRMVQIEGEVNAPGIYQIQPGETLPQLLARAGGLTASAYVFGTELARNSVREQQQRNLNLIVRELESQLAQLTSETLNFSAAADQQAMNVTTQRNRQIIQGQLAKLRSVSSNGRIALELSPSRQRLPDIALEDGDVIRIPPAPGHVSAVGAVYNDSVLVYRPGRTVMDYLQAAGISNHAERFNTFVVRADGTIVTPPQEGIFSFNSDVSGKVASIELMPGDTIVVPEKLTRESGYSVFMRGLKDWTQVIYQLGLSAAAIKVLQ